MMILVTYDVDTSTSEGAKRLRKVAKECVNFGHRVQNSVFECVVSDVQYKILFDNIRKIINKEQDSVRFYFLGKNWERHIVTLGKDNTLNVCSSLIV